MRLLSKLIVSIICLVCSYTVFSQPVITSFTPASGPIGTIVTITGQNFDLNPANNIVYFGPVKAIVSTATSTSLSVIVPQSAMYTPIAVTVNGLTAYSNKSFVVTFPGGGKFTKNSFAQYATLDSTDGSSKDIQGLAIADFNGDGKPDVSVVDRVNNLVFVYQNITTGPDISYAPKIQMRTGIHPDFVASADIDGDGKLDLIVENSDINDNTVYVYRNISSGNAISFDSALIFSTGIQPSSIAVSDLDGDGKPDLAFADIVLPGDVSVLKNTSVPGNISFASKLTLPAIGTFNDIKVVDLDGDGKKDIVASNFVSNNLAVFRNTSTTGNLSFAQVQYFATDNFPDAISFGDLDGDGKADLAVCNFLSNTVSLFRNTSVPGIISFATRITIFNLSGPTDVTITDFDGDGKLDLAVLDDNLTNSYSISLLKNYSGPGYFSFGANIDYWAVGIEKILATDFNGDGRPDIAISSTAFGTLILENSVGLPFLHSFTPTIAGAGTEVIINGESLNTTNGVKFGGTNALSFTVVNDTTVKAIVGVGTTGDVTVSTSYGSNSLPGFKFTDSVWLTGFSPVVGTAGTTITITGANLNLVNGVFFGGVPAASFSIVAPNVITAVVANGSSGNISVTSSKNNTLIPGFFYTLAPIVRAISPAKGAAGTTVTITGSGFNPLPDSNVVYFGGARATITSASANSLSVIVPPGATYLPVSVTTNHLTGYSAYPFTLTFPSGGKIGSSSFAPALKFDINSTSYGVHLVDLDADGKLDMLATSVDSSKFCLFHNTSVPGNISFDPKIDYYNKAYNYEISSGDVNGDGKQDVFVNSRSSIYSNSSIPGTVKLDTLKSSYLDIFTHSEINVTDLNFDGLPDLYYSGYTVDTRKNISTPNGIAFDKVESFYDSALNYTYFPPASDKVMAVDLDGDGKPDFIALSKNNFSYISLFHNNSTFDKSSFSYVPAFDIWDGAYGMCIADVDGDGKPDILISNYWDNIIFVYKNISTSGHIAFADKIMIDGVSVPEAIKISDLNGDGKPDIIVASNFNIAVLQNNSTSGNISFGSPVTYRIGTLITDISIGDVDGDGKPDIAASGYDHTAAVLRNQIGEQPAVYLCDKSSTILNSGINAVTYQWQINKGNGFVSLVNDTIVSGATEVSVKLTKVPLSWNGYQLQCIVNGGSLKSSIFTLKVNPVPLADAGPDVTICGDDNGVLIGVPGIQDRWYNWQPAFSWQSIADIRVNGTSQVRVYPSYTQEFVLTVSNAYGCSATDTMTVNVNNNPQAPVLTPGNTASICDTISAHLQSTDTLSKLWYFNNVLIDSVLRKELFTKRLGNYTAKNVSKGCISQYVSNSVLVIQSTIPPPPVITQNGNVLYSSVTNTNLTNNWYRNGVETSTGWYYYNLTSSGTYTATVTYMGCTSAPSNSINVVLTAINSPVLLNEITIMPNPVKDRLWITHMGNRSKFSTVIYNMEGKKVFEGSFTSGLEVNMEALSSGLYVIQITNEHTNEHIQKMIFKN